METKINKPISEYNIGDKVEILTTNPRKDVKGIDGFWHDGEVVDIKTIYPSNGTSHRPYQMLLVKFVRTYCKATPVYKPMFDIMSYTHSTYEYYDKESTEGFFYVNQIKPKEL